MPEYNQQQEAALRQARAVLNELDGDPTLTRYGFFILAYQRILEEVNQAFPDTSQLRNPESGLIKTFKAIDITG